MLLALALSGVARAEPAEAPLLQMRSAAEQLAEVAPEPMVTRGEKPLVPPLGASKPPASASRGEALRQLAWTALRGELARELERQDGVAPARVNAGAKDVGTNENAHDASAQARTAAAAAQQAKQAHSVATQHISATEPKSAPESHR